MIQLETAGVTPVLIREPVFGDSRSSPLGIRIKTARDGSKWAYSRPIQKETLTMSFRGLDRDKAVEIMNFRNLAVGKVVTLRRDPDEVWIGELINDPIQTTQEGRANNTLELIFQGVKNA